MDSKNSKDKFIPPPGVNNGQMISLEVVKSTYICEGLTPKELSERFFLPMVMVENFISENKLDELRAAHIKHGLSQLQNIQLVQAEKLMNLETQFKRLRIAQLEKMLEDYVAYYSVNGHFYKLHPLTGEILRDTNGIPMQIKIPNVTSEITQLKESVSLSEGLKVLLNQIDDIIKRPQGEERIDPEVIDVTSFDGIFQKRKSEED